MEVSAFKHFGPTGLRGPTPLLRLQGDERLVALTRRGNQAAYEALVARYQVRLLAFCRHMLGSREDAEDVLQEVFAAAFNAMTGDNRPLNVRPWLYRIARNRCLNHLRRQTAIGVDSMDVHLADHGTTTAEKVDEREDFRLLVADVQTLAETQRTALLLREIDALSYEQIAEAMDTTVPSVKSLLVRARVALAESAESRRLTCEDVREELGAWAEGLGRVSPPVRRHVRSCDRCGAFKRQLRSTNRALAALFPVGPLLLLKKLLIAHGAGGAAAGVGAGTLASSTVGLGGATAGGALSAGVGAIATKAAAGLAAVAIVTTGAVEVDKVTHRSPQHAVAAAPVVASATVAPTRAVAAAPTAAPTVVLSEPQPMTDPARSASEDPGAPAASSATPATATSAVPAAVAPSAAAPAVPAVKKDQEGFDDAQLPAQPALPPTAAASPALPVAPAAPAVTPTPAAAPPATAPLADAPPAPAETAPGSTPVPATPAPAEAQPPTDATPAEPVSTATPATPVAGP